MKHGPSHLFPDHVIVNFTLQEYAAFSRLLEAIMKGEAIPLLVNEGTLGIRDKKGNVMKFPGGEVWAAKDLLQSATVEVSDDQTATADFTFELPK